MSNPTTPFGWQMPENTDLVTDLPADFEVFGQAVATDLQYLLGGTTGQVLAKASATDLDFDWVAATAGDIEGVTAGIGISGGGTSGTVTVTNSMATAIDAKGDLVAGTGADTFAKLTVGADGTSLVADSSEATGLKWQAASGGGANWSLLNSGGTALTGATTITVSGISGKDKIAIFIDAASASASSVIRIRLNGDTGSNYNFFGAGNTYRTSYDSFLFRNKASFNSDAIELGELSTNGASQLSGYMMISGGNASGNKVFHAKAGVSPGGGVDNQGNNVGGFWNNSATITSVSIVSATGNFDNGSIYIYTSA